MRKLNESYGDHPMTQVNEPEEGGPDDAQLDAWIEGLQGGEQMQVTSAYKAGGMVRDFFLRSHRAHAEEEAAYTEHLVERWASMGLLGAARRRTWIAVWRESLRRFTSGHGPWWALSACGLAGLFVAVGVGVRQPSQGSDAGESDAGINRGDEAPLSVTGGDVSEFAQRVSAVLQRHAVPVRQVELSNGTIQLQAKLPVDATIARRELAALGIDTPASGRLNLVISKRR